MKLALFILILVSCSVVFGAAQEPSRIEPSKPIERELSVGESHTYQIKFTAGEFVRFRLDQRAIDASLTLTEGDNSSTSNKKLIVMNLTGVGEEESLSFEAERAGGYRLIVRGEGSSTLPGSYRLETTVRPTATAQDRQRLKAEALLIAAKEIDKQQDKAAQQAVYKLEQALAVWRELDEPRWVAFSLYHIGSAYADRDQEDKAIGFYDQALAKSREFKLRAQEGRTLNALGSLCYTQGRYDDAIEYQGKALAISRELKDRAAEGGLLNDLALTYLTARRLEKVFDYFEQALVIERELKERANEASILHALGVAHNLLSHHKEATSSFEQALAIFREVKDRSGEARVLEDLGIVQMSLSHYEKAIDYYEQGLEIRRADKQREEEGYVLTRLGGAYSAMGRYDKAIEYSTQALALTRETKARWAEGRTLLDLGSIYNSMGNYDKAIECLEQALPINREVKDQTIVGFTLSALGSTFVKQDSPEKAVEKFEQALAIYREVKRRPQEGSTLNSLGGAYRSLGQYDKAIQCSEQALAIAREVNNPEYEIGALSSLALTESKRGDLTRARTLIEEGLKVAELLRSDIRSPASRASLLASVQRSYQLYTDVLMRQHKAEPNKGLDSLAVEVSERQRARSLLDLLTEAGANLREGLDPSLIERESTLAKQLNEKARQLAQATKSDQIAVLRHETSELETNLERAQVAIRNANPHYAALVQPQPLKLNEIQAQLEPDTVLLEYALGEERSYLWAVTRDSLRSYELPKADLIDKNAREVYALLTARSTTKRGESALEQRDRIALAEAKMPAAVQSLSRTLLGPVASEFGNKRLVIVADGALQYIPFAMLPDPVSGIQQPLIIDHEIVSLPSASALAIQRTELSGRQPAPRMLAVIADPVFDRTDVRLKSAGVETGDKEQTQAISFNDVRSLEHLADGSASQQGASTRRFIIPRLPFTRLEATRLLALAPKSSSFGAMDFQANRETVLKGELKQYRYIHFATHGVMNSERPGLSSLVLSMVDERGKQRDGFLRANDIYNLKLPAELVVLSACQTGLGKEIKGEGLVGLTRGFMYAGAARVVVSLWNVNDRATAELMSKFYEGMLKQGERPAAALRAAQVEMWKQKQWQSPYYWAAFTMQGEWR